MMYEFPESLGELREWLRTRGLDVKSCKSERQAAFMAQQMAGTRLKFPSPGMPCFMLLQSIQRSLPASSGELPQIATGKAAKNAADRGRQQHRPNPGRSQRPIDTAVPAGLVIYADGACEPNPGAGGWGFAVYQDGVEIHCESGGEADTTNQRMELMASLRALEWAASADWRILRLFSDSMYTVNGCNDWRHKWKRNGWKRKPNSPNGSVANLDLWMAIDAALIECSLKLEWVKGHAGIIGNERADELSLIGRGKVVDQSPTSLDLIRQQLDYSARA